MALLRHSTRILLLATALTAVSPLRAQDWKSEKSISVLFGLTQPLLVKGFNIEGNVVCNRLIFDYSHGISLDFSGSALPEDLQRQEIAVHMPYTTGFGVGYRFTKWLNLRVEPKWHRFAYYYAGEAQTNANVLTAFNTFSLGLGLYGSFHPFKNNSSFLRGFMVAPSIRFWPTVHSTLEGNTFSYTNKRTMAGEEIRTPDPGIGFTPLVVNVSIGYTFPLRRGE